MSPAAISRVSNAGVLMVAPAEATALSTPFCAANRLRSNRELLAENSAFLPRLNVAIAEPSASTASAVSDVMLSDGSVIWLIDQR